MAYWLLKTEPEEFSWDDQVKRGAKGEAWSGVRNFAARGNLKEMKKKCWKRDNGVGGFGNSGQGMGTGMFLAIKWHYDQGKLGRVAERRAVMRMAGLVIVIFVPLAAGLLFATFYVCEKLGLT